MAPKSKKPAPGASPSKGTAKKELKKEVAPPMPEILSQVDAEELEEQQDAVQAAASTSAEGGNAAAIAAANGSTEMSASFKNFRHHPDMENFYRFIYENDLRHEALAIIDEIILQKQARRQLKAAKGQAH